MQQQLHFSPSFATPKLISGKIKTLRFLFARTLRHQPRKYREFYQPFMRLLTCKQFPSTPEDFVNFWEAQYRYHLEYLYEKNIGKPLNPKRIHQLFHWKNGFALSTPKRLSIERNFINKLACVNSQPNDAKSFLEKFPNGGAIWRIFWLHCCHPTRYPIYDQHVHRAMRFILYDEINELHHQDEQKILSYLEEYLPFIKRFSNINQRSVDKALWAYGKFIKIYQLP